MSWIATHLVQNEFITQINGISITLKGKTNFIPLFQEIFRKLKYNFARYKQINAKGVATFGGAYSNHLAAVAAAGKSRMPTIGLVRGEELAQKGQSHLGLCEAEGMRLYFLSRETIAKRSRSHGKRDRYGEPICSFSRRWNEPLSY